MSDEQSLRDLYAYNSWANGEVFAVCRGLDRAQLEQQAPGTFGSLEDTLKHLIGVEDAYFYMLQNKPPESRGPREEYAAHDLAWFAERAAQLGEGYAALLAGADAAYFQSPLDVPWFEFALTKRDGLHQVLSHSAQHRAQVFSVLGAHSMEVPDLDYVLFVEQKQSGAR
jgi:uncharacterized damage-inducible protein DinB